MKTETNTENIKDYFERTFNEFCQKNLGITAEQLFEQERNRIRKISYRKPYKTKQIIEFLKNGK